MKKILFGLLLVIGLQSLASAFRIELPGGGELKGHIPGEPTIPPPGELIERVKSDPLKLIINPLGYINTTGIPTQGDFMEYVIKEPDKAIVLLTNPGQWPYTPVANAMISGRNAVIAGGGQPIPPNIKALLARWYPPDLLNSVRWTSNWSIVQNTLQAAQMTFNPNTNAITLINAVIFRNPASANDPALWAHEVFHVQQYREWGVFGFAKKWVDNSSINGPVESPAYRRESEARIAFSLPTHNAPSTYMPAGPSTPPPQPHPTLSNSGTPIAMCGCWGIFQPNRGYPAPICRSGLQVPRICPGMCPMGQGVPWQPICL